MSFLFPRALADAIHVQTAAELRWQVLGSVTSPFLSAEWEGSQALAPGLPRVSPRSACKTFQQGRALGLGELVGGSVGLGTGRHPW